MAKNPKSRLTPATIRVELYHRSRDINGNATAKHRIFVDGALYANDNRRHQIGCTPDCDEYATVFIRETFGDVYTAAAKEDYYFTSGGMLVLTYQRREDAPTKPRVTSPRNTVANNYAEPREKIIGVGNAKASALISVTNQANGELAIVVYSATGPVSINGFTPERLSELLHKGLAAEASKEA